MVDPSTVAIADVRASELLDRLVLTPRNVSDRYALSRAIKAALPTLPCRQTADGISIPAGECHHLLVADLVGTDLCWCPEARQFAENRKRVREVHDRVWRELRRILRSGRPVAAECLRDIEGLDVLDDHQWVNVAAMTVPGGYGLCLFDEQGAGKTVTFIFAFDVLVARDEVDVALIIAPKSMIAEWPQDFKRFMGDRYSVAVAAGPRREKRLAMRKRPDVLVTNFETCVSMEQELRSFLRRYGPRAVLVIDESFYAKNLDAKRTRAVRRLREWCGRAFVLCGTPAPNAPDDLVQQFSIVDFGLTFERIDIPEDREASRPVVQEAIEKRGLFVRHQKRVVLPDLPAKRFHRIIVPLQPVQRGLYATALHDYSVELRAADGRSFRKRLASFLARRSALLQICSNPAGLVEGYTEVPAKLRSLDALLDELVCQRQEKVVVWSFFTASLHAIWSRYQRFGAVLYDGSVTDVAERREIVRKFQEDNSTMLLVANPAAAGAGLTLHRARFAIYESMSNQAAHYLQSLDRIHRRGQMRDVEYLVLLCDRTLELREHERLAAKERTAQLLLGDSLDPPITRESMLAEATDARMLLDKGD